MAKLDFSSPLLVNSPNIDLSPAQLLNAMHGGNVNVAVPPVAAPAAAPQNNSPLVPLAPGGNLVINGMPNTPAIAITLMQPPLAINTNPQTAAYRPTEAELNTVRYNLLESDGDDTDGEATTTDSDENSTNNAQQDAQTQTTYIPFPDFDALALQVNTPPINNTGSLLVNEGGRSTNASTPFAQLHYDDDYDVLLEFSPSPAAQPSSSNQAQTSNSNAKSKARLRSEIEEENATSEEESQASKKSKSSAAEDSQSNEESSTNLNESTTIGIRRSRENDTSDEDTHSAKRSRQDSDITEDSNSSSDTSLDDLGAMGVESPMPIGGDTSPVDMHPSILYPANESPNEEDALNTAFIVEADEEADFLSGLEFNFDGTDSF